MLYIFWCNGHTCFWVCSIYFKIVFLRTLRGCALSRAGCQYSRRSHCFDKLTFLSWRHGWRANISSGPQKFAGLRRENVCTDDGYPGQVCKRAEDLTKSGRVFFKRARSHQETVNPTSKSSNVLAILFLHGLQKHKIGFEVVQIFFRPWSLTKNHVLDCNHFNHLEHQLK